MVPAMHSVPWVLLRVPGAWHMETPVPSVNRTLLIVQVKLNPIPYIWDICDLLSRMYNALMCMFNLFTVSFGNHGCQGGNMYNAYQYVIANEGVDTLSTYSFQGKVY